MKWLFKCLILSILVSGCANKKIPSYELDLSGYHWPETTVNKKISLDQIIDQDLLNQKLSFFRKFIGLSYDMQPLYRPFAIAVNETYIAVSDSTFGVVYLIEKKSFKMTLLTRFNDKRLKSPVDMAFHNNQLYIIDSAHSYCIRYTPATKVSHFIDIQLDKPTSISIDRSTGTLFITDTGRNLITVADQDGNVLNEIHQNFNFPIDTALDTTRKELYVLDAMQFKVKVLSYDGKLIRQFGHIGTKPGSFSKPKSIALDHHRRVYVIDSEFDNFQIFDFNGQLLYFIGNTGNSPAQFYLPSRMTFYDKKLYISDTYNSRLQVFNILN